MVDNIPTQKQILINQLKSAYRKYKTQIYYDNHSAIQRCELADFEREKFSNTENDDSSFFDKNKIDTFFDDLAEKVINKKLDDYSDNNIIVFPKKMKSSDKKDNEIISNFRECSTEIEQSHYFIDLPVEAHILGVLWILRCGYVLDDRLYKNCYGNRLNKHLVKSMKEKGDYEYWNSSDNINPFLFEPYYKNYESWRDNGLDSVKNLMEHGKHAIMIALDFKNYYYSTLIDFELMWKDICDGKKKLSENQLTEEDTDNDEINAHLTCFIQNVFEKYNEQIEVYYDNTDMPFIPIGFLPSMIIANWNLQGFDQAILEDVHPSYYGRYVDDILIVLDSHEKSETYGEQYLKRKKSIDIIKKYLYHNDEHPHNNIFDIKKCKKNETENDDTEEKYQIKVHNIKHRNYDENDDKYFIYENLEIQQDKVKLFSFYHEFSTGIIDNFKKEIAKNSSEFKLMKDSEKLFDDFEDKLFDIDYDESINKITSINNVEINKFEISKLMSGVLNSSAFASGKIEDNLIDKVIEAFNSNLFEFFTLWEKLLTLLYITGNENKLKRVIENILIKINELNYDIQKNTKDNETDEIKYHLKNQKDCETDEIKYHLKNQKDCETDEIKYHLKNQKDNNVIKKSLKKYLYSTVVRVLSLKSSELYQELSLFKKEENDNTYLNQSFNFILSSMVNNSFMKYPLQNTFKIEKGIMKKIHYGENIKYDLIKENAGNKKDNYFKGYSYPRYIKFHEILLNDLYNKIHFREKSIDELNKLYARLNFYDYQYNDGEIDSSIKDYIHPNCKLNCHGSEECPINKTYKSLKVGNDKKTKVKVGIVNTKLNMNDFKKRLIGKPNLKSKRFNKIKRIINKAIENKVDLLIMPEMYIPFEWMNDIISISKVHQIAMIFGMEPIISEGQVYNYIVSSLPFSVDDSYFEAVISCRLKNHYSPSEERFILTHNLSKPKKEHEEYYLYSWNGIYIAPFYCYEIADIESRGKFKSCCDIVTVSEFNKDEIYFGNIAESLSRDNYCYCIKSNTSEFGGNSIIQPSESEMRKIIDLKGGENDYLVVQELNINRLRNNAIKSDLVPNNKNTELKPNPPGLNNDIIKERMGLENKYSIKKMNESNLILPQRIEKELFKMITKKFPDGMGDKKIGIWGVSLKSNIFPTHTIDIVNRLHGENVKIKIYESENDEKISEKMNIKKYCESKYDALENADALIILSDKEEFKNYDITEMKKRMKDKIIFDMMNITSKDVEKEGFKLYKIKENRNEL